MKLDFKHFLFGGLSLFMATTIVSCKDDDDDMDPDPVVEMSLYDELGGTAMVSDPNNPGMMIEQGRLGIRSVVDSTIFVIAGDARLEPYFVTLLGEVGSGDLSGFTALSTALTDFFCVATGAENFTYNGLDMVAAHDPAQNPRMGFAANDESFNWFIADVVAGATQVGVADSSIAKVGALIETLRDDVVQTTESPTTEEALYVKVGGSTMVEDPANPGMMIEAGRLALRSVVDSTIFVIAGDNRINGFFTELLGEVTAGDLSGFTVLSKNLTDFFCVATGAENFTYGGLDMKAAHDPAQNPRMDGKASNDDMDAFIDDVVVGAQQNGVPMEIIAEVGALLETLRADVVQN